MTDNYPKTNFFQSKYDFGGEYFPVGQYFVHLYQKIPNLLTFDYKFTDKVIKYLNDNYECINTVKYYNKKGKVKDGHTVFRTFNKGKEPIIIVVDKRYEPEHLEEITSASVSLYYTSEEGIEEIAKEFKKFRHKSTNDNKVHLVIQDEFGFDLQPFTIKTVKNNNLDLNYGKSFKKIDKELKKLLSDKDNGLVLLHGKPGTGKTTYLKSLMKSINKKMIFVPPFLVDSITHPNFLPFLLKHSNSILIIEEAEKIIAQRNGGDSTGVSNLLNLTDGIIGDCLNIQVIATFNTSRESIDKALLRKGRLLAEHEFGPLSVEESNILLNKLDKKHVTKVPMTLADIYNHGEGHIKTQKKRMGF